MTIVQGIESAIERIDRARDRYRRTDPVTLELAVKTRSLDECVEAATALANLGRPVLLGHNHVQEARATAVGIRRVPGARIHLIGHLQSNKINQALTCIDTIETIDSTALVDKIDARAHTDVDVFIEVNVSAEPTKHGCAPADVPALVEAVTHSEHLRFSGFMTVGLNAPDEAPVRAAYARLRELRDDAAQSVGSEADGLALSMGMSADLDWAIAEGATIVRLGTAVFGHRRA